MKKITRTTAFISHLLISGFIFFLMFFVFILLWYPSPFFSAAGGWHGLTLAALIGLVLGPLLTLIVFNVKKSKHKLIQDLLIISILQCSGLFFGIYTIYIERPVAITFWDGSFYSVTAKELHGKTEFSKTNSSKSMFESIPIVYVEKPLKTSELQNMLKKIEELEQPPHHQTNLYKPFHLYFSKLKKFGLPIEKVNERTRIVLEEKLPHKLNNYIFFPLFSKYANVLLVFDIQGNLVKATLIEPSEKKQL